MAKTTTTKLTEEEAGQLIALLEKVRLPAPYAVFAAIAKSLTLVAVDVAVMPDSDRILLTHRTDQWYNHWHIPGGMLLSDEDPRDAVVRVTRAELGLNVTHVSFAHYFFERTVRGNEVILLFKAVPEGEPTDGKYFPLREMPEKFLEEQQEEINYLKKNI